MLVAASKQFFGLGGIPTAAGQFSPSRSPGQNERTRGGDGGSKDERGADRQHLTPPKRGAPDEEGREQSAAYGAPARKARKRQLIEPATAPGQHKEPGECDPGNEAESTKEEREREVGIDAEHPTRHEAQSEPCCCPREAHPECTANASQPLPHDRLRPSAAQIRSLIYVRRQLQALVRHHGSETSWSRNILWASRGRFACSHRLTVYENYRDRGKLRT